MKGHTKSLGARHNDGNACVLFLRTHRSARRMRLKSWHLHQPIANLSFVCFICRTFIPMKILASNIISCNSIYDANGMFKSWGFYRSHPSASNKQSVHIVRFPGCRCSCPSVGHTAIYGQANEKCTNHFVSGVQLLLAFSPSEISCLDSCQSSMCRCVFLYLLRIASNPSS